VKINGCEFPKFMKEKGNASIGHSDHIIYARIHARITHTSHAHASHVITSHGRHNVSNAKIARMPHVNTSNASNGPFMSHHI
jgi:hypothetical protein